MKIVIGNDLHADFGKGFYKLKEKELPDGDVLILAGDILELVNIDMMTSLFKKFNEKYETIIWVAGNHEYYNSSIMGSDNLFKVFAKEHKLTNFIFVSEEPKTFIRHGYKFIVAPLWTDFLVNQFSAMSWKNTMNDHQMIKFDKCRITQEQIYDLHNDHLKFIKENAVDEKCVVVTHHAPSFKSASEFSSDYKSFYYCTELGEYLSYSDTIKLWAHGHTHQKIDYMIGDVRIVSNPHGYFGMETIAYNFNWEVVELP